MPLQDGRIIAAPDDQRTLYFVYDDRMDDTPLPPEGAELDLPECSIEVDGRVHLLSDDRWRQTQRTRSGAGVTYVLQLDAATPPTTWLRPSTLVTLVVAFV